MKMNNILKTTALLLGSSVLLSGCIKETFPESGYATSDQTAESPFAKEGLITAMPTVLITNYTDLGEHIDFGYPGIFGATDRMVGEVFPVSGNLPGGNQYYDRWQAWLYPGNSTGLAANGWASPFFYTNYYKFIFTANEAIDIANQSEGAEEMMGIAKTFRALCYLDLARLYDALPAKAPERPAYETELEAVKGLTVPIVREDTSMEELENNPRVSREEMFKFIFEDLNTAETLLANYTPATKNLPSLAVIYGLKARAYLWLGGFDSSKYADAATYARKAIDASKCTIMTETEWLNPKTGFNKANNSWMWYLPQSTEGIANLVNFAAWRSSEATWGYGGKYVFEGVTSNFYNEISDTDWRKRAFVGPDAKYADYSDITNLTAAQFANLPAYANLKFHPAEGETATYSVGNVTDIPMMRVEEMYLIEAEATAHADASAGLQLLKTFMAKRDPEFSTSAVSSADVVEEIIWNKRIELWGEGVVFYDFKRLNYSLKTGYVGTNVPSDCRFSTDGRAPWWNFCIPETETQQNTALESQNNPNPVGIIDPWVQ